MTENAKVAEGTDEIPLRIKSTKTYTHSAGLSACFRQWRAESHCRFLHGYALQVRIEFEAAELDARNWVVDFGSLKSFKGWLEDTFDHKTLVAEDDPQMKTFEGLAAQGLIQLVVVPACGCEKFAEFIYRCAETWLQDNGYGERCVVSKVEVSEHGGNSAIVEPNELAIFGEQLSETIQGQVQRLTDEIKATVEKRNDQTG